MTIDSAKLDSQAADRYRRLESSFIRRVYRVLAQAVKLGELGTHRLKALYFGWAYWRILFLAPLSFSERLGLIRRFAAVDWNVIHGHRPAEVVRVTTLLARGQRGGGDVMIEAGCWRGGSTAKFSHVCAMLGLRLLVYDSFEGVEELDSSEHADEWRFGGQYACDLETVRGNVRRFGREDVCEFHKGWFADTLARTPPRAPVRLAYIDCDLAKGTFEAMQGAVPNLVEGGHVLSQDFHITPVRKLLLDPHTWESLGVPAPRIQLCSVYMAQLDWPQE